MINTQIMAKSKVVGNKFITDLLHVKVGPAQLLKLTIFLHLFTVSCWVCASSETIMKKPE